jgi:hypothetical protein
MENFKVLPFKSINLERGKSSRNRRDLELVNGDFFFLQRIILVWKLTGLESLILMMMITLTRFLVYISVEPSWGDSKDIYHVDYSVTNSDVYISDIMKFEPTGSTFPALQSAAAVVDTHKIFVWGGYNTEHLTIDSDLLILTKGGPKFN